MSSSASAPVSSAKRLEGKVAIITGGASGIGESTARLFWKHGAKVIIADIQDEMGEAICQELDINATYVHCNVTNEDDIRNVVDTAIAKYGKLDIMYNNAGIIDAPMASILTTPKSDIEKLLNVNFVGAFLGTKHAARVMVPTGKGCILFTGSVGSILAGLGTPAYIASKHAIAGLVKSATAELGQYGIRVNCVSPFAVPTNIAGPRETHAAGVEAMVRASGNLKGVMLEAEDIANAALFLASDDAKYVSGLNLAVDGGFTVVNPSLSMLLGGGLD